MGVGWFINLGGRFLIVWKGAYSHLGQGSTIRGSMSTKYIWTRLTESVTFFRLTISKLSAAIPGTDYPFALGGMHGAIEEVAATGG